MKIKKIIPAFFSSLLILSGCSSIESKTTESPDNACQILRENKDWLYSLERSYKKWGTPISVQLAIIRHESSFRHNARPINYNRRMWEPKYQSSALGYSQALDGTWGDYKKETKNHGAERTSFSDSSDFIGWYTRKIRSDLGLRKTDTYNIYLAYHQGINNYKKGSYKRKKDLQKYAKKVYNQSKMYSKQINMCRLRKTY